MKLSDLEQTVAGKASEKLLVAKEVEDKRLAVFEMKRINAKVMHDFLDNLASREPIRKYATFLQEHTTEKGIFVGQYFGGFHGFSEHIFLQSDGLAHFRRREVHKPRSEVKVKQGIYVDGDTDIVSLYCGHSSSANVFHFKKQVVKNLKFCLTNGLDGLPGRLSEKFGEDIPDIVEYSRKNFAEEYGLK